MKAISKITSFAGLRTLRAGLGLLFFWSCAIQPALAFPPQITTQPTNQTVQVGGAATFVVQVTSGSTLTYQWYFQSNAIPGATNNSYVQTNVQFTNVGTYFVGVTNADGGLNSTDAILTVVDLIVTNSDDSGAGSLRQAILDANAAAGTNTITFNIAGSGVHTITPISALPAITGPVVVDGWSVPNFSGTPVIELNGTNAGTNVSGLVLGAGSAGSVIRGVVVNSFGNEGLEIWSSNNVVVGNYFGTDATGLANRGNANDGIELVNAANNRIGGTAATDRNIISGNGLGIRIAGSNTVGNVILGNYIGADATGSANLGNRLYGVFFSSFAVSSLNIGGPHNNLFGGTLPGAGNMIMNNGLSDGGWAGVALYNSAGIIGNAILGNSIFANGGLGIDLGASNSVTANDSSDGDIGPNNLQNFPVITAVGTDGSKVSVAGRINTTANTTLRLEFFVTDVATNGNGEGKTYLGYANVITDGSGNGQFVTSFSRAVAAGQYVTATATVMKAGGSYSDTSEFATNVIATSALIVDTTTDVVDGNTSSVAALLANKGTDGKISLREAIIAANNTAGTESIFLPAGTYILTRTGAGEDAASTGDLDILGNLVIVGAGASSTAVNANGIDRVFHVLGAAQFWASGITISGGNSGSVHGAGVYVTLLAAGVLNDCVVSGNTNSTYGAGLRNEGTMTLDRVRVTGNSGDGGAGVYNTSGMLICNSLFDGNSADTGAGAIWSASNGGNLTVFNSTLSGNISGRTSGGLVNAKLATLINASITANSGTSGGGLQVSGGATTKLQNTIIAGNTCTFSNPDVSGGVNSLGCNIIGNTGGSSGWVATDRQNVNPLLNSLAENGGATPTHSLQPGSPAINAGNTTNAPAIDQRGFLRDAQPDMGACEYNGTNPNPNPDVAATVSGPTSVFATSNFTYTISVANLGGSTASNIVVSDVLPAGVNVLGVSGNGILVGGGPGQVVFDSASSNNVSGTLTWTHVTTTAPNRLMLMGISITNEATVGNVTYAGLNLTRVQTSSNTNVFSEIWQLVNPPSGPNVITITRGETGTLIAGAATFSGVDQGTPLSAVTTATGYGNSASITINSATNEIVFDDVTVDKSGSPTAGAGQTQLWSISAPLQRGFASIKPGANSVTMSWAIPNDSWAYVAASVKSAGLVGLLNWTIPSLASGAATNFTVTVTAPLSGTLTNTVSSTADTPDSNNANNSGSAATANVVTTVNSIVDLVTAQSGPTIVSPLTNYTCTVTVSNQGPCSAQNVVVSDTLDPRLTFVSASAGGTYLAGVVTWPALTSLAKGATANFTVTVRSPLTGTLTNFASCTSATTDLNAANNDGSAPTAQVVTIISPLQVENTSKGASVSTLSWSHTISPGSSRILVVGVSVDSPDSTIVAATFANFLPLIPIGQTNCSGSKVAMFYLINPPVGTYPISINLNSAVGIVGGAVSFTGVNQANPITGFRGNSGTNTLPGLDLTSTLGGVIVDTVAPKSPQYATNTGAIQDLQWNLYNTNYSGAGSTAPGALSVSPSYTLNSAAAWAMGAVALNPATVLADLTVTATGPANVPANSNLTYLITVTNLGNSSASNVVVSDVLPAGTTFVSASAGGINSAGVVSWPVLTNLVSGAGTNYTITITAPVTGILTNIVYGTSTSADPDPSNNNGAGTNNKVVTTITSLADVGASVTGPTSVLATADFSYSISITNAGPSPATDVVVSDTLPAGVTFVSASDGAENHAGVVNWSIPILAVGEVTNFTISVAAPPSGTLLNSVASISSVTDLVQSNNDGSAPDAQVLTTVTEVADVATSVTGPVVAITNTPFNYTITVTNLGPSGATGVSVNDLLPAGVLFVSATAGGTPNARIVTWSLDSMASGATTNLIVTVVAPGTGPVTNMVSSSALTGDPDPSNNNGSASPAWVVTGVYPFLLLNGQWRQGEGFQVEFYTYPDSIYSIQAGTNLVDWVTLITTNSGDGHVVYLDTDFANYLRRFYRIRQGP